MFTTPEDYYKTTVKYFSSFPKTFNEAKELGEKVKKVIETEKENTKEVISTYNRALRGCASYTEVAEVNKKAMEVATAARFAATLAIPGAIFALPLVIEASKEYDFKFLPESVIKEFNL